MGYIVPENTLAYRLGVIAKNEYLKTKIIKDNPYPKDTDNWKHWNKGWNKQ